MLPAKVLSEQPDPAQTIGYIAKLLIDISELYGVPNFSGTLAVKMAEWIIQNYKYDQLKTVEEVLKNPPATGQKREWRLTPDTIREWMAIKLDQIAEQRERKWHNIKKDSVDKGRITEEEMTPLSKATEELIANAIKNMKSDAPKRTIFLNRYNIGEECPKCEGKGLENLKGIGGPDPLPCRYCEGKGAIGIVEIKAETEVEARQIYEARFNVKL